jgi:hypothetical protein
MALVFVDIFEAHSEARQSRSLNAIQSHPHSIQQEEWTHAENQGHGVKDTTVLLVEGKLRKIPRDRLGRC